MFRFGGRHLLCSALAAAGVASPGVVSIAKETQNKLDGLSPHDITQILDKYIVGQKDGKKAVAISLRNRWRRRQLKDEEMRKEIVPKNMLLIGPTGVGKTEIARRMARITDAPFIKVEATKYTEVGFKGKDVESIIEELYTNAKGKARKALEAERQSEALNMALDTIYSAWMVRHRTSSPRAESNATASASSTAAETEQEETAKAASSTAARKEKAEAADGIEKTEDANTTEGGSAETAKAAADAQASPSSHEVTLDYFRKHYKDEFKDDLVTIDVAAPQQPQQERAMGVGGFDFQSVGALLGLTDEQKKPRVAVTKKVSEAVPLALQESLNKLIDDGSVNTLGRAIAEEEGIVFIDEIDKVVAEPNSTNADVSSTGVQQDLLPLVEGSNVTMKDGSVISTDNVLFICSGAFHVTKTSDMIAELQGRLPVRVQLKPLTEDDFRRILREPKYNLLMQQTAMLETENIKMVFTEDGVNELARVTCAINTQGQNIGARRLNTVLERVMDTYSFNCEDYAGKTVEVTEKVVKEATEKLQKNVNLAKYLL